jgi:histidinol-phosphate aminotransferase
MTQQTSTGPAVREAMDSIPAYVPGKPPAPRDGLETFKLSSNENPYPPLPGVLEAVVASAGSLNRYPDMGASRLYAAIARRLDVPESHLALGTGSVAVALPLLQAVCADGDEVVLAWRRSRPTDRDQLTGARGVPVALTDGAPRHDLRAMSDAGSPSAPRPCWCARREQPHRTGVHRAELEDFLQRVPPHVWCVCGRGPTSSSSTTRWPQVWTSTREGQRGRAAHVLQPTVAGLRVGFGGPPQPIAAAMRKAALPFGGVQVRRRPAVASLAAGTTDGPRTGAADGTPTRRSALVAAAWDVPQAQQLVWLPLGEDTVSRSPPRPRRRHHGAARSRRRRADQHRRGPRATTCSCAWRELAGPDVPGST